ncbi:trehalose-phosphatase [Lipingzhangella sp. LS1_29]|uniref:Trehalose 6-phosphate phosphatase n=1 Tax=Lipingzhangella rawalii TaxID=2055835 RepID=A0ABU2H4I9_9ACTN|nr:trehalose-phosphatase [Lipingzhangella rawalii]MDS1270222.1 trehalose-phosphatase [Lipingzhangella rawalii]
MSTVSTSTGDLPSGLPVPETEAGRRGLSHIRADPSRAVVALDYDGTLAPIVTDPGQAQAHPRAAPALRHLSGRLGGLAIITGRPAADVPRLGPFEDIPSLVVLGAYGNQRWQHGQLTLPADDPGIAQVRAELPTILAGAPSGTHLEDKGQAIAVHTRGCADPAAALAALRPVLTDLAERTGLLIEPGRMVLELRPGGMDKGAALRGLVAELGATSVLYAGDDLGDIAAFDAVDTLREQGMPGLCVCSGSAEVTALASRADLVVDGPAGVVALLSALAAALSS